MEVSGAGKSPNTSLSFRYNANNEELEELFQECDDDPPTPQSEPPIRSESASPKKTSSIIDKYFKSIRNEKPIEKLDDTKQDVKPEENRAPSVPKEVTSSPMKDYLNRLGKRSTSEVLPEGKEQNETWKIFHDFKFKIAQAVEDMKTRSVEETREKTLPRENSTSDSEENSAIKDSDQQSIGDTDNQVSSLDSSIQNLSDVTQPLTAKATEQELHKEQNDKNHSDTSDDTHKNLAHSESDLTRELLQDNLEVESGIEALEDNIDAFGDLSQTSDKDTKKSPESSPIEPALQINPSNFGLPPSKSNLHKEESTKKPKAYIFKFSMYFLTIFLLVNYLLFPNSNAWNGFLMGIWVFYLVSSFKEWVLDTYFTDEPKRWFFQLKRSNTVPFTYTIPSVKEHRPLKKYEGWINHYRSPDYDPYTYHINKTTTAFMKLEGCNLRISYTRTKIAKRALWDEKIEKVTFYQHRLYNLTGAKIVLLPKGLVRRRQWSKKYPICIVLNEKEKIQVLEKENVANERKLSESLERKSKELPIETESTETNTSPEKKKKFVWRKREKSISHSETETGKEGLRHRIVRKMHKDKKVDSTPTTTEPENQGQADKNTQLEDSFDADTDLSKATSAKDDEDELDDSELSRIKEFLEETEMEAGTDGAAESEWSVHVKPSRDKHSYLFLFARTGRDKHEWYRRFMVAISESRPVDTKAEEKLTSENAQENKDGIEMAVYKLSEKETVAFGKSKASDTTMESVTMPSPSLPMPISFESYEKSFWPYINKIIQSQGGGGGGSPCECRALPAEVAWANTLLARLMYDVMRDPHMVARVQNRIQRKLNTLKLPSFMSPLVITSLRLAGACPLLGALQAGAADARGAWLHARLRYDGGATITILTQINLMKLKEKNVTLEDQMLVSSENVVESDVSVQNQQSCVSPELKKRKPAIYDSDVEDSAESSSDDESPPVQPVDSAESLPVNESTMSTGEVSSKKKFLRMVDKIATNKYFQTVTDYKYVKRAMEGLSNTDIKLQLEVHGLEGQLAINLPPPPHDRLWIGFSTNPQLVLKARPAVGARTLRFAHISNWIEQKLTKEFEKVLVLPNMEDIIIDVLTPTPVEFE